MRSIRVVSLFCGAGFADLALLRAAEAEGVRVEIVDAIDSWGRAVNVYNRNHERPARVADVKTLELHDLPAHDLVIGGPPCQPFSNAGKRTGHDDLRNCIADFVRLSEGTPYVMENVKPRLLDPYRPGYWSEQFCAANFGDVTSRRRWFYSSHLLQVIPTPGSRRFRDIRDPDADRLAAERSEDCARKKAIEEQRQGRTYNFDPRPDDGFIGSLGARNYDRIQSGSTLVGMRSYPQPFVPISDDGFPGSLTSHSHDQPLASGQSRPTCDGEVLGTLTSGKGGMSGFMKVAMRGHGSDATEIADDAMLSSVTAQSTHGLPMVAMRGKGSNAREIGDNEHLLGCTSRAHQVLPPIAGVRCVSLLEMQRAHSIPETWDWGGSGATDRGKMIANGWPVGMGTAVLQAILRAL